MARHVELRSGGLGAPGADRGTYCSCAARFSAVITISSSMMSGMGAGAAADTPAPLCWAQTTAPGPTAAIDASVQPRNRRAPREVTRNRYDMAIRSPLFFVSQRSRGPSDLTNRIYGLNVSAIWILGARR